MQNLLKSCIAVCLLLITINVQSQNIEKTINVESFDEISLGTSADVFLTQGDVQEVRYVGTQKMYDDMKFEVRNGDLVIKMKDKNWWNSKNNWKEKSPEIHITVKSLNAVSVGGSGDVVGKNTFHVGDFDVSVAGSGEVDMDLIAKNVEISVAGSGETYLGMKANDVEVSIAGSGEVELEGTADDVEISISGSGECNAEELIADTVDISISGSGEAEVHAKNSLVVSISGSGDVVYSGNPSVSKSISGSGDVDKR